MCAVEIDQSQTPTQSSHQITAAMDIAEHIGGGSRRYGRRGKIGRGEQFFRADRWFCHLLGISLGFELLEEFVPAHIRRLTPRTADRLRQSGFFEGIIRWIQIYGRTNYVFPRTLIGRDVDQFFAIEVNGRHCIAGAECFTNDHTDEFENSLFVGELDFSFGRVDIDIDLGGFKIEIQEVIGHRSLRNDRLIGSHHGFVEVRMTHEASVHEEVLQGTSFASTIGAPHEAGYIGYGAFHPDGYQIFLHSLPEYIEDSFLQRRRRQILHQLTRMVDRKSDLRIDQSHPFVFGQDMPKFRFIRFEEFSTCRYIVEEVLHTKNTALWRGDSSHFAYFGAIDGKARTQFIFSPSG